MRHSSEKILTSFVIGIVLLIALNIRVLSARLHRAAN